MQTSTNEPQTIASVAYGWTELLRNGTSRSGHRELHARVRSRRGSRANSPHNTKAAAPTQKNATGSQLHKGRLYMGSS